MFGNTLYINYVEVDTIVGFMDDHKVQILIIAINYIKVMRLYGVCWLIH